MPTVRFVIALLVALAAAPAAAAPIYTFESVPAGTFVPFSETSDGVTATFTSSDSFFVFDVGAASFDTLTENALFVNDGDADTLDVAFSSPFSAFSFNFALRGPDTDTLTVQAFSGGVGGTLLGSTTVSGAIPGGFTFPEGFATIDLGGALFFDTLRITSTSQDFGIDELALRTPADTAVPEPTSMLLLGTGLVGLGARRWRQRKP